MPASDKSSRVQRELFLRAFFAINPPARVTAQLSRSMRELQLEAGETLYELGDTSNLLHFVVTGCVELSVPGKALAPWIFGAGALIGMFDASIPRPHPRRAVATEATTLLALEFADYVDALEDNFGFAVDTMMLAARTHAQRAREVGVQQAYSKSILGQGVPTQLNAEELGVIERLLVLRQVGLFQGAPVQALTTLAQLSVTNRWKGGTGLRAADGASTQLQIVARGSASLLHEDASIEFCAAGLIGGLGALGGAAIEQPLVEGDDVVTIDLALEDLFDVAEDHFDVYRAMLSYVAQERAQLSEASPAKGEPVSRRTI